MGRLRRGTVIVTSLVPLLVVACISCAASPSAEPPATDAAPRIWHVPEDVPTLGEAVASARPGDLVLIGPGRYQESVRITTPGITIRGTSRNDVVLDGGYRFDTAFSIEADGVAIENLTVRTYAADAIRVGPAPSSAPSVDGFRLAYVTAANSMGDGVLITGARRGLVDHVLVSGVGGRALSVQGCQACTIVVTDTSLQLSKAGVVTEDADGVTIARSVVKRNRTGIRVGPTRAAASASSDAAVTLVGLDVTDNDNAEAPGPAGQPWGDGIVVSGTDVLVLRNHVVGHRHAGIWLTSDGTSTPNRVQVRGNRLADNGTDLVVGSVGVDLVLTDSCFADNVAATTWPPALSSELACDVPTPATPWPSLFAPDVSAPGRDFRVLPLPAPQPSMPGPVDGLPAPVDERPTVDVDAVPLPPAS